MVTEHFKTLMLCAASSILLHFFITLFWAFPQSTTVQGQDHQLPVQNNLNNLVPISALQNVESALKLVLKVLPIICPLLARIVDLLEKLLPLLKDLLGALGLVCPILSG